MVRKYLASEDIHKEKYFEYYLKIVIERGRLVELVDKMKTLGHSYG